MPYKDINKAREASRKSYLKHKDKRRAANKEYELKNKEKLAEYRKQWKIDNKDNLNKIRKERLKQDPLFKLKENIRCLIRNRFIYTNNKKNTKTETILGCGFQEFKQHLESQFEPWMNWDNGPKPHDPNGPRTWQIDHKIPVSFGATEEDIIKLNHYSNLRPYCSEKNLKEGNRRDGEKLQI